MNNIISSGNEILKFNSGEVIEISESLPIPLPYLWLIADKGIVKDANGKVSQWQDQSPSGFHANQETQINKPTLIENDINGHSSLHFNGSNLMMLDFLENISIPVTKFTFFGVFSNHTLQSDSTYRTVLAAIGNRYDFISMNINGFRISVGGAGIQIYAKSRPFPFIVFTIEIDVTVRAFENKILRGTVPGYSQIINGVTIGRGITDHWWIGNIAEILAYNTILSNDHRQSLENYLMLKYAI